LSFIRTSAQSPSSIEPIVSSHVDDGQESHPENLHLNEPAVLSATHDKPDLMQFSTRKDLSIEENIYDSHIQSQSCSDSSYQQEEPCVEIPLVSLSDILSYSDGVGSQTQHTELEQQPSIAKSGRRFKQKQDKPKKTSSKKSKKTSNRQRIKIVSHDETQTPASQNHFRQCLKALRETLPPQFRHAANLSQVAVLAAIRDYMCFLEAQQSINQTWHRP
jgi:hypothetical protein